MIESETIGIKHEVSRAETVAEIPIDRIRVNERKRKPYADIWSLANSIRELGLVNPITVSKDHTLIAGYHRLTAFKLLGRATIPATVLDVEGTMAELAEIDENLIRFDLIALERADHLARRKEIYEELHPETRATYDGGDFKGNRHTLVSPENGLTRNPPSFVEDTAKKARVSKQTVYDYVQIGRGITKDAKKVIAEENLDIGDNKTDLLKLAKEEPEQQVKIVQTLASGKAKGYQDARRVIAAEKIQETTPIAGKYRVIYADPPWEYGGSMNETYGTADKHYPTMKLDDICDIPVAEHAEDNAVLFLWATSPQLPEALTVISAWGFTYKASFVWDKQKHVMGHYNSVRHELLLIATRGSCTPENPKLFDSVVSEPRTEHSRKPETFRTIIDTIYPSGNRIELFAREPAEGWEVWGNQV